MVRHLVEHLKPGGRLLLNFSDDPGRENLVESAAEREATVAYLASRLVAEVPLGPGELYACYVKPSSKEAPRIP